MSTGSVGPVVNPVVVNAASNAGGQDASAQLLVLSKAMDIQTQGMEALIGALSSGVTSVNPPNLGQGIDVSV